MLTYADLWSEQPTRASSKKSCEHARSRGRRGRRTRRRTRGRKRLRGRGRRKRREALLVLYLNQVQSQALGKEAVSARARARVLKCHRPPHNIANSTLRFQNLRPCQRRKLRGNMELLPKL
jgi:hypothetical protein